jgi:hypothetical protein
MFREDIPARFDQRDQSDIATRIAAAAVCAALDIDNRSIGLGLRSFGKEYV